MWKRKRPEKREGRGEERVCVSLKITHRERLTERERERERERDNRERER
jgi:hypothetical protein